MPRFFTATESAEPFATGEEELRAFLGDRYAAKSSAHLIEEWIARPRETPEDIEEFYRATDVYLYDLTQWHASHRFPYAEAAGAFAARRGFKRLLEFGCGIGSDGLRLLNRGFDVTFYDFRNPSTEYLEWRLKKRGIGKNVIKYAGEDELPDSDLTLAIDVIEHVVQPAETLKELARHTKALVVHLPLTTQKHKYPMHFDLNKPQLRRAIRGEGFQRVRDFSSLLYKGGLLLWLTESPEFWVKS